MPPGSAPGARRALLQLRNTDRSGNRAAARTSPQPATRRGARIPRNPAQQWHSTDAGRGALAVRSHRRRRYYPHHLRASACDGSLMLRDGTMDDATKPTLFICYSHTDQKYRQQFPKFLDTERIKNSVTVFSDAAIEPGEDWQKRILDALHQATAALVLVSQDFMISPFIQQVELRDLLATYIRDGLRLYLVPVR